MAIAASLQPDLLLECRGQVDRVRRHARDRAAREHQAITLLGQLLQRLRKDGGEARAECSAAFFSSSVAAGLGQHVQHPRRP